MEILGLFFSNTTNANLVIGGVVIVLGLWTGIQTFIQIGKNKRY